MTKWYLSVERMERQGTQRRVSMYVFRRKTGEKNNRKIEMPPGKQRKRHGKSPRWENWRGQTVLANKFQRKQKTQTQLP